MEVPDLPVLPYDPIVCLKCTAILNPYARVDYQFKIWLCHFCFHRNLFPKSHFAIGENNLHAKLSLTHNVIEYRPYLAPTLSLKPNRVASSSSVSSLSTSNLLAEGKVGVVGLAFVFMVDLCTEEDELRALKNELLLVVFKLPENATMALVTSDTIYYGY